MTWLSVKEVAYILKITERMVRINVQNNKYKYFQYINGIGGNSGKVIQIALESLSLEAQDRYHGIVKEKQQSIYQSLTATQRSLVDFKHSIVLDYKEFKNIYPRADKMQAFLSKYNGQHPNEPLTKRQLNHWENLYDRDGINGLVDRRGGYNKGQSSIPEDAWNVFKKLWLQESQPTVQSCYDMTVYHFPNLTLPHVSTFARQAEKIPEPVKIRYREGKKAYKDKCEPFIPTDYTRIYSNQQWVADHHIFDVLVVDESGYVFRPWLSGWEDRKSRAILGYTINKISPNSDIVLDSFARACYKYGIPDEVKLDNGKDYKVYDLFNKEFSKSVVNEMNIKVSFATPYNAKAKPIERLFGTLEQRYCKHLSSYIGNDPKKRPEKMKKLNTKLKEVAMPYDEFVKFVENMVNTYNSTVHSSLNGKTPIEAYKENFINPMRVVKDIDVLKMFLMRTSKPITVGRNGIKVPAIGYFFDDAKLFPYKGKKVYARYNSEDVRSVYVFSEDDEFICIATSVQLSEHGSAVSMELIRELARKKKERNKFIREQMPDVEVPTVQEFVEKKTGRFDNFNTNNEVIQMNPIKHKHAKEIRKEEKRLEDKQILTNSSKSQRDDRAIDKALYKLFQSVGG